MGSTSPYRVELEPRDAFAKHLRPGEQLRESAILWDEKAKCFMHCVRVVKAKTTDPQKRGE